MRYLAAAIALCLVGSVSTGAGDEKPTEKAKIESLIKCVEAIKDAKFVRNGSEYSAKDAARFLRGKWDANESKIKTARDFIAIAGTKSSTTGKPYLIRFADGKETPSAEFLAKELDKIEKPAAPPK